MRVVRRFCAHSMIYGYKQLSKADDWRDIVGADKWVPTRSAYELAQRWHAGSFPPSVRDAFQRSGVPELQSLRVACLYVEHPTFLDTFHRPSCTDIMVHCRTTDNRPVIVGVEGKATEPFAEPVQQWITSSDGEPAPTRLRRLQHLSQMLGITIPPDSSLRYQLVHRTASIVNEAALHGAAAAVVLVHSFAESPDINWLDFQVFLRHLGTEPAPKNTFTAPCPLGPRRDIPTHFIWITDEPIDRSA